MTPGPELRERILTAARSTPSPTRPARRSRQWIAYLAAALGSLGIFWSQGGFEHGAGRPAGITLWLVAGASVIAIAAVAAGMWRGRSSVGRPVIVLASVVLAVPVVTFVWMVSWRGVYVEPFERFGWRCMGITLSSGILVLAAGVWARWKSVPVHAAWHGAAIAVGAGALASVVVNAWCPLTNAPHVLVGHVAPMVILGLIGALIGSITLAIRR